MGAETTSLEITEGALLNLGLVPLSCVGSESISELFSFTVEMFYEGAGYLDAGKLLGKATTLHMNSLIPGGEGRLVHGCISEISCRGAEKHYWATVVPELWKAGLAPKTRTHVYRASCADVILMDLIKNMDGNVKVKNLTKCTTQYNFFDIQYNITDLEYLRRILCRFGISFYFEFATGSHTLVLFNSTSGLDVRKEPLSYDLQVPLLGFESLTGWSETVSAFTGEAAAGDFDLGSVSLKTQSSKASVQGPDELKNIKSTRFGVGIASGSECSFQSWSLVDERNQAKIAIEREQAGHRIIALETNTAGLRPGQRIKLSNKAPSGENSLVIVSVTHRTHASPYGNSGGTSQVLVMPDGIEIRPPEISTPPVYTQLLAKVMQTQYGAREGADLATVTVVFPWDETKESFFMPVSQQFGGDNSGSLFLPQQGDTVLVTFMNGDSQRPMVSGIIYNGKNKTPPFDGDNPDGLRMGIKAPSGTEWSISEKPGEEELYLRSSRDMQTVIDKNDIRKVGNNQTTDVRNNQRIKVSGNQDVRVDKDSELDVGKSLAVKAGDQIELAVGPNKLTIDMNKIELKGPGSSIVIDGSGITVKANGIVTLDGVQLVAKGKASTEVSSSGLVQVKGGVVMIN